MNTLKDKLRLARGLYRYIRFRVTKKMPPPKAIFIDPINVCNLHCPLCPRGINKLNYHNRMMTLEKLKVVIEKMPFVKSVNLYNWGEPFLNTEIFPMIRFLKSKGVRVVISTNFSLERDHDFFVQILESGLDRLVVSLDGASPETYIKYRVGGDFNLVMSNMKKLAALQKEMKIKSPQIVWQFLVNRFNEHEVPLAHKIAQEVGVEMAFEPIGLSDDLPECRFDGTIEDRKKEWLPKNPEYVRSIYAGAYAFPLSPTMCDQLFFSLVVQADGKISPCCFATDEKNTFGDLMQHSFNSIWDSDKYYQSRMLYIEAGHEKVDSICVDCENFNKKTTLMQKIQFFAK